MKVCELNDNVHFTDILKKYIQWETIEYANDFSCQCCGGSRYGTLSFEEPLSKPILKGWCETNYGFMAVMECPRCGSLFRFHPGFPADDFKTFCYRLGTTTIDNIENGEELDKMYEIYFNKKRKECEDYTEWKNNYINKFGEERFKKFIEKE